MLTQKEPPSESAYSLDWNGSSVFTASYLDEQKRKKVTLIKSADEAKPTFLIVLGLYKRSWRAKRGL